MTRGRHTVGFLVLTSIFVFVNIVHSKRMPYIEDEQDNAEIDITEGRIEYFTVHQITQITRRKRDAVDHVIFSPIMAFDLDFRDRQINLRLKRHEYMSSDIHMSDENGAIQHDLKRKTGLYVDPKKHASFVVQCEDYTEHCSLRGSMIIDGSKWDISPEKETPQLHKAVQRPTGRVIRFGNDTPPIPEHNANLPENLIESYLVPQYKSRVKRDIPDCEIVESMAIVDETVWEYYLNESAGNTTAAEEAIGAYYTALYLEVDDHYGKVSIRRNDTCIRIYFSGVTIQKTRSESWSAAAELNIAGGRIAYVEAIQGLLTCGVQGNALRTSTLSIDMFQCFTRKDIVWNENSGQPQYFSFYRSLGFRETACNPAFAIYNSAIIEAFGDAIEVLVAHEIGHGLGAQNDGDSGCSDEDGYIMADQVQIVEDVLKQQNVFYFSTCSVDQFFDHLSQFPACLQANSFTVAEFDAFDNLPLPGLTFSREEQCESSFGNGSVPCDPTGQNRTFLEDQCSNGMFCTVIEFGDGSCSGQVRPYDGTPCGDFGSFCLTSVCQISAGGGMITLSDSSSSPEYISQGKGLFGNCTSHVECSLNNSFCNYVNNICECAAGFYNSEGNSTGPCLAQVLVGESCTLDVACLDPNALCVNGTCTCTPAFYTDNGTCNSLRCVGEECNNSSQCVGNFTECSGSPQTCRCPSDRFLNLTTGDCDLKKDLGSSCEAGQCGTNNSVCGSVSKVCECQEGFFDDDGAMTPGGNCLERLNLGENCTRPDSCTDPNAECMSICQCQSDFFNDNGVCEHKKCVGEQCLNSTECQGTGVECLGNPLTCKCPDGTYLNDSTGICDSKKDLGRTCEDGECGPANSVCSSTSNVCECQEGFFDTDGAATAGGNCTAKFALGVSCSQPDSCADPVGVCSGTCQCPSDFFNNNGTCERKKCVGESCFNSTDCLGANVECLGTPKVCQCPTGFYLNDTTADCDMKKDLGRTCEDGECGPANSVCSSTSNVCECQEGFFDTDGAATAGGNCTAKFALGVSCSQTDSCADPVGVCSGTCQCPSDFFNNNGTCERKKCIGESCFNSTDCLGANVECLGTPKVCQCPTGFYLNDTTADCDMKKDLGRTCEDGECGPANSVCSSTSNVCECQEGFFDTDGAATAGGNCTAKFALGVSCSQTDSCADPVGVCSGICQCPSDFFNNNGTCERKKCIGESCFNSTDCLGANVECLGTPKVCQCPTEFYLNDTTANCDMKKDLGRTCEDGECGPANSVCSSTSNVCECQEGFFDTDGAATAGGNCTAKFALGVSCSQPDSCADPVGVCSGTCQCPSDFFNNNGTCERKKCVGESCFNSTDCLGTNVECLGTPKVCQCPTGFYLNDTTANCDMKKDLGRTCEDGECGPANSVCSSTSNVCECQEGFFDTDGAATAGGNCTAKFALGVSCSQPDSCADPVGVCSGTCQCPSDFFNNNGTCERKKCVGESCFNSTDCLGANVECLGTPKVCQCPTGFYLNDTTADCDMKKDLGRTCKDGECEPANSVCSSTSNVCECQEGFFDTDGAATAGGNCTAKFALGVSCSQPDSCADPVGVCSGTCQCPSDFFNNNGTCERKKCVGESCFNSTDCLGANVECLGTPKVCQCPTGFYLNDTTADCDMKKDLGRTCEDGECGPANSVCSSTSNVCECQEGFFDTDGAATAGGNCTAKFALGVSCSQPDSCADPVGVCSGTCQCPSDFFNNNGTCERKKCVGESCFNSTDCLGANVECLGTPKVCQCPAGFYLNDTTADCDMKKDLGRTCEDGECGPANSVCSSTSNVCECQEGFFDTDGAATAGGNCTAKFALGVSCSQPDSCADPVGVCSGTCQCPSDFFNNNGTCERKKCVGESCFNSTDCLGANVECLGTPKVCQCPTGFYLNDTTADCDMKKDLGRTCEDGECEPANSVCSSTSNVCECQEGFFDTDGAATAGGNCTAKFALGVSCSQPDSCADPVGVCSGTCQCPSDFFNNNGTCERKKCVGESCFNSTDCLGANVECLGTPKVCQCPTGFYLNDTTADCDMKKDLGRTCEDGECGPANSVCSSTSNVCECQEGFFDTDGAATAGGNCTAKFALGVSCSQPDSCADPVGVCSGTCQCPSDFFNNNGTCERKKCVGESCFNSTDCLGTNVECLGTPKVCQCPTGFYLNDTTADCDMKKDLGRTCEAGECEPANSVCSSTSNVCECQEGFFDTDGAATAGGNCTAKFALGVSCSQPDSCADPVGVCSGTCQCPSDFFNNNGTCERKKCVGESCFNSTDCLGANVECLGTPKVCQCPTGFYLNDTTADCDMKKDLGRTCEAGECEPANSVCSSTSNVCECQEGFFDTDGAATAGGNCTAKFALGVSCSQPDSCADPVGVCSGTCQCPSDFFNNNGTCERKKCVGESCFNSTDCLGTNVECLGTPKVCQCPTGFYLNDTTADCDMKKDLGRTCEDGECEPANSVCSSTSNVCECQEGFFDTDGAATAGGNCTAKFALGVSCSQPDSCADPVGVCSGTCQCPSDFFNNNGTCERKKCVGESCFNSTDCLGTNVECLGTPKVCQCPTGFYLNDTTADCDMKKDLGRTCEDGECEPANSVCSSTSNVCECQEGFFDTDGAATAGGNCTAKFALGVSCSQPDSCADPVGVCSGTCQCPSDFFNNNGTCERKKCVGESCFNSTDCLGANVECLGTPKVCQCPTGFYLNDTTADCDMKKDLGRTCEAGECEPANSVCSSTSNVCECQEGFFDTDGAATAGGNCTAKFALGVSCSQPDSCADPVGVCSGTCQCPSDFFNNNGTCERKKCVGESCFNSTDCLGANVECLGTPKVCQCPTGFYLNDTTADCDMKKDLGRTCEDGECGPANSVCSSTSNVCECQEGFFDTDGAATAGGNCTAKFALGVSCSQPDSCADPVGVCSGTCQCPSDFFNNNGTCERKKCVGESCFNSTDCLGANVECLGTPKVCQCPSGFYLNDTTADCDMKKDLGRTCEDGECGPANSVCSSTSNVCECQEGFFDTDGAATAGGNCTAKFALGVSCSQPDSCADPVGVCSGTCQCPSDFFNNNGTCERKKCVGESCFNSTDCLGADVECLGTPKVCQCPTGFYLNDTTADCDMKKDLGRTCEDGECGPANSVCSSTSNVCECQEGFFDTDGAATAGGNCTAKFALGVSCSQPDSCADPVGVCSGTCQCPSDFFNNNGTCERKKCVGESCFNSTDCLGANVECLGTPKVCQCPTGFYLNDTTADCDMKKDLGRTCEDGECGPANSVCSSTSNVCECQEGFFDTDGAVTAGGNCTAKFALGVSCSQPDSCADPVGVCSGTCQCPSDFFNNNGTCERKKCVGESCFNSTDCLGANVECLGTPKVCQCPTGFYLNDTTADCDMKKDLGRTCEDGECEPANSVCSSTSNVCECQEGFFDTDGAATAGGNCTAKFALGVSCSQPDSCADPVGVCSGTCQCPSDFFNNNGTCERKKCVGESCFNSTDCLGANVECLGTPKVCQCPTGFYLNDTTADCDMKKDLGRTCEDGECGPANSVCSSTSNVCECQEGFFDTDGAATAGGNCTAKFALGVSCSQPDSCADPVGVCSGTCQCPSDFFNNNGTCERKKCVGESCFNSTDCLGANVECLGTPKVCQCPAGFYLNDTTADCDMKKDLGRTCEDGECGPANSVCSSTSNVCECQEGFFDTDGAATAGGNCTAKFALGVSCSQPDSCADPVGVCSGTCQCPSDFFNNNGTCERKKCVGESCFNSTDCLGANVECLGTPKVCQCPTGFYLNDTTADCDMKKDLGRTCEDGECGPANSVCSSTSNVCECQEGFFDTDGAATAGGNCTAKFALLESCTQSDSCADPNAICSGTCQCPSDFFKNNATCERKKCVGEPCNNGSECLGSGVECIGFPNPQFCQCPSNLFLNDTTGGCDAKKILNESCKAGQCDGNAYCHPISNTCQCAEGFVANGTVCDIECPADFVLFNNSCYFFGTSDVLYNAARDVCDQFDSGILDCRLVQVDNQEESDFLKGFMSSRQLQPPIGYWNDLFQFNTNGNESWRTTGDPLVFVDWDSGQPNDRGGSADQFCAVFAKRNQYRWIDQECATDIRGGSNRSPYFPLCEIDYRL